MPLYWGYINVNSKNQEQNTNLFELKNYSTNESIYENILSGKVIHLSLFKNRENQKQIMMTHRPSL